MDARTSLQVIPEVWPRKAADLRLLGIRSVDRGVLQKWRDRNEGGVAERFFETLKEQWLLEKNGFLTSRRVRSPRRVKRVGIGGDCLKEEATRRRVRAGAHFQPTVASWLPFEQWIGEGRTQIDAASVKIRAA